MRILVAGALLALLTPPAYAKGPKKADKTEKKDKAEKSDDSSDDSSSDDSSGDDSSSDDSSSDDSSTGDDESAPKKKGKAKAADDEGSGDEDAGPQSNTLVKKQDLTGHDLGTAKKTNEFEKDRFFVDKVDTDKTEGSTLVQGSLTSSSFAYHESGGNLPGAPMGGAVTSNSPFDRYFTDLRLQTDFRHISGGRWEARLDGRIRMVSSPDTNSAGFKPGSQNAVQSGLTGQNEYELRELWLIRNGERTDVIIGRQFVPDLGALKIDGVRIDYASSNKLTFLGFGGLYPLRGSRSLDTDYANIDASPGNAALNVKEDPAGPFVGAAGFGAAYRTPSAYGSFGGVSLIPLKGETARVYATSTGYWRYGSVLDIYHFALIDLVGAAGFQLTNLSAGANLKPNPRLRLTASVNHVDTETLNVQANGFLQTGDPEVVNVVQNEVTLLRLSTDQIRGSVSAGLGALQRFEITIATSYRRRPSFTLYSPAGIEEAQVPGAHSVEVYGSVTDRRSIKDARIGVDGVQTFAIGTVPFSRSQFFAARVFAGHDIKNGQGEWEAELQYATSVDSQGGMCNNAPNLATCFGFTNSTVISAGSTFYYRFNRDWFGIASLYLSQTELKVSMMSADPAVLGLSGYLRLAYRY